MKKFEDVVLIVSVGCGAGLAGCAVFAAVLFSVISFFGGDSSNQQGE